MKRTLSILALTLTASALTALAQDAPAPGGPAPGEPKHERHMRRGGPEGGGPLRAAMEALTPEERKQFMEARQKAEAAPEVAETKTKAMEARKAVMEAMKAAMVKADPSLAPIVEKMHAAGGPKELTPEERQKLQAARKSAMADPDVQKAMAEAQPLEKAHRDALHAAMLKADPTIGPILEKVEAAVKEKMPRHKKGEAKE